MRAAAVAAIVHVACVLTTGAWIFFVVRACVRACVRWGLLFATMMIAAQLLATHFSSTAANHAQANARILWFVSLSSLPLSWFINMPKPYTPIIHYLCADDGSRWMLSCLLLQFGLFASAIAGLLALFCLQQDVVCAFQSPIAAAASFVVWHQGGGGRKESRREEGDRLLLKNWVEAFEL